MHLKTKKRIAFTLAEVLITLTMIGILAAMIIPSVLQKMQEIQLRTAWKNTFSDVSQAANKLASTYSYDLSGIFNNTDDFRNKVVNYMSVIQKCDKDTPVGPQGCWHSDDKWFFLGGTRISDIWPNAFNPRSRVVLSNSVLLVFELHNTTCTDTVTPDKDTCGDITVDTNGFAAPNIIGKDIFRVYITRNGKVIPAGAQGTNMDPVPNPWDNSCDVKTYTGTQGWACSVDYLKQ